MLCGSLDGKGVWGRMDICISLAEALCMRASQSLQSCPALCDPMDCSHQVSLSIGTLQARILKWVAMSSFPTQALNQCLLCLLHWQAGSLSLMPPESICCLPEITSTLFISYPPMQDKKLKKKRKTVEKRSFQEKGRILRKPLKLSVMWLEGGRHGYVMEGLIGHGELELNSECIGRHRNVLSEGLASSNLII